MTCDLWGVEWKCMLACQSLETSGLPVAPDSTAFIVNCTGGGISRREYFVVEISYFKYVLNSQVAFLFLKFDHSGCAATKRKVCLGPGIDIQAMQEPPGVKSPGSMRNFPLNFQATVQNKPGAKFSHAQNSRC